MRIKYSIQSNFLQQAKQLLLADRDSLNAGNSVCLDFGGEYKYREDDFILTVSPDEPEVFLADWWNVQTSLFPARAKAVATALRDFELFGSYGFSNHNQRLEITRLEHTNSFPVKSHSWEILSKEVADKKMDRSSFLHHETGIPGDITWFFGIQESSPASSEVSLVFNGKTFAAKIILLRGRYRLYWQSDFANTLGEALPNFLSLHQQQLEPNQDAWMRFQKTSTAVYKIKLCTERGDQSVRGVTGEKKGKNGRVPHTGYWTLISNPKVWHNIYDVINSGADFHHQVRDADVRNIGPGQLAVLRVGIDRRTSSQREGGPKREPGVYAVVEIISEPVLRPEETIPNLDQTDEKQKQTYTVNVRCLKKLTNKPLLISSLKDNGEIADKYLLEGFQGSSIPLKKETFDALVKLADAKAELDSGLEKSVTETLKSDLSWKFRKATPRVIERISKTYERGNEGELVKKLAGRKCQINEAMGFDPYSFKKSNGEHYCEAHHVVPVSSGEKGTLHPENVICVSADRHRQLHYGNAELVEAREYEFEFLIEGKTVIVPNLIRLQEAR